MITEDTLSHIYRQTHPVILAQYVEPLNSTFQHFDISTSPRIAAFLAQAGHESACLTHVIENLNYGAGALLAVFPTHFHANEVAAYARNPQKIANRVYANRLGNGPEASGDGWAYRGRGLIQITGKANYQSFATSIGRSLADTVEYLETPEGAAVSAGWFWSSRGLNNLADSGQFAAITRKINGGLSGQDDRELLWNRAKKALAA